MANVESFFSKSADQLAPQKPRSAIRERVSHSWRSIRRFVRMNFIKTRFGIEVARNLIIDLKYGGLCGGTYASRFGALNAWGTSSVDYCQMSNIFDSRNGIDIAPDDVLVDVGCGKGRVLNWWLNRGLKNRLVGIELDPQFADPLAKRLRDYPNVEIICGNVLECLPRDGTLFFLFNPFKPPVMKAFKDRLIEVMVENSRVTIVYYMCLYVDVFRDDPRWVVEPLKTKTFWQAAVIRLRRADHERSHADLAGIGSTIVAEGGGQ